MKRKSLLILTSTAALTAALLLYAAPGSTPANMMTGKAAFTSYKTEAPGLFRKITVADLPDPNPAEAVSNSPTLVPKPADAWPESARRLQSGTICRWL